MPLFPCQASAKLCPAPGAALTQTLASRDANPRVKHVVRGSHMSALCSKRWADAGWALQQVEVEATMGESTEFSLPPPLTAESSQIPQALPAEFVQPPSPACQQFPLDASR